MEKTSRRDYSQLPPPKQEAPAKRAKTNLGLVCASFKNKVQSYFRAAKNTHDHNMATLSSRTLTTKEKATSKMRSAYKIVRSTTRRVVIGASVGAIISGVFTATVIAAGISNPFLGIPLAIGLGVGATGAGFITGAGAGATLPITKEAVRRLSGMNVRPMEKRIAELKQQNKAQQEVMAHYLNDSKLIIAK